MTAGDDPQLGALRELASNLRTQFEDLVDRGPDIARQAREVSGSASSADGLITATVDARGQLVQLDIDPRIYRRPDSRELADSIVATVRAAVDQAQERVLDVFEPIIGKDRMRAVLTQDSESIVEDMTAQMSQIGRQYE